VDPPRLQDVINFMRDHEEDFAFWIVDDESFEEVGATV